MEQTPLTFPNIEAWTNGWHYDQEGILRVYSQESCIGCGYNFPIRGTACYAIEEDTPEPPKGFPFNMQTCPLCKLRNRNHKLEAERSKWRENTGDVLTRRLVALREASK